VRERERERGGGTEPRVQLGRAVENGPRGREKRAGLVWWAD
jgi:hypothetical protein